jgi:hypothetical protein
MKTENIEVLMMVAFVVIVLGGFFLFAGVALTLADGEGDSSTRDIERVDSATFIETYYDEEREVVCYTYDNGYAGGLSCLPINETSLVPPSE